MHLMMRPQEIDLCSILKQNMMSPIILSFSEELECNHDWHDEPNRIQSPQEERLRARTKPDR